jgi:hypothetical protein
MVISAYNAPHWRHRMDARNYYNRVLGRLCELGPESLVEIGPGDSVLSTAYFYSCPRREVIDKREIPEVCMGRFNSAGIKVHQMDILAKESEEILSKMLPFDALVCLQVLEHVKRPAKFVQKVWDLAPIKIFSVPFEWHKDEEFHVHSGITVQRFTSWFPAKPARMEIVWEKTGWGRLIGEWKGLKKGG